MTWRSAVAIGAVVIFWVAVVAYVLAVIAA
jgi:hypothetical protein